MATDDKTRTELEAAVYRRLVEHLRGRTDVQNIDLMNLAGFCRNCLSNWMKDAADARGVPMSKEQSREIVYGMPYDEWRAKSGRQLMPGILKCFSHRPDFLREVMRFSDTVHFSEGHLNRKTKEAIASWVSYLNRCPY